MTATIKAHNLLPNRVPAQGSVVITVNTEKQVIRDPAGNVVFQGPLTIKLVDGQAEVQLPASDDATLQPSGFTFTATEQLAHVSKSNYRRVEFQTVDGQVRYLADYADGDEIALDPSYGASLNGALTQIEALRDGTDPVFSDALDTLVDDALAAAFAGDIRSPQGIVEWWHSPNVSYHAEPYRHDLVSSIDDSDSAGVGFANLLLKETNWETGQTTQYIVGKVPNDDHNSMNHVTGPGLPIFAGWHHHGNPDDQPNLMHYKTGFPDRAATVAAATEQTINFGAPVSYRQSYLDAGLSDSSKMVVQTLYRRNLTEWYLAEEHVTRARPFVVTAPNNPGIHLTTGNGLQHYIKSSIGSQDGQIIRCAMVLSPASEPDWVVYFEINLATGAITSPFDPTFSANLDGTNLPIGPDGPRFLNDLTGSKVAYERRLLDMLPWPADPGLVTAEGDPGNRAATAHYWKHTWAGEYTEPTTGDPAPSTGLISPNGSPGYAKTTEVPTVAGASKFRYTTIIKLPPTKPADDWLDIAGQMNDASSTSGWYLWLAASAMSGSTPLDRRVRIGINRVGNPASVLTSPAAMPGLDYGETCGLRSTYTVASVTVGGIARRWTLEFSADTTDGVNGTWTEVAAIAGSAGALVVEDAAYTFIGARAMGRADDLVTLYSKLEIDTGAGYVTRHELDFTSDAAGAKNWPGYQTEHTDAQSNDWALVGAGYVGRTAYGPPIPAQVIPVSVDYGSIGGGVKASPWASYYWGAVMDGDFMYLARVVGDQSQLVLSYEPTPGTVVEEVLRSIPTSEGYFFRPMKPLGGGPAGVYVPILESYGSVSLPNEDQYKAWKVKEIIAIRR